jgi:transposase
VAKKASSPEGLPARREYSFEIVDKCEGLYVQEEKSLEAVAKESGVSVPQIQRWAKKYEWKKKKEEFRQRSMKAQEESRALMREEILLEDLVHQRDLMKKFFEGKEIMEKGDTQMMYAYTNVTDSICKILADMRKRDESLRNAKKIDRPQIFLEFMRDLVSFLKDHDPSALTALEKNFDEFIGFAKTKYS